MGWFQNTQVRFGQQGCTKEHEAEGLQCSCPTNNNLRFANHGSDKDERLYITMFTARCGESDTAETTASRSAFLQWKLEKMLVIDVPERVASLTAFMMNMWLDKTQR